MTSPRVTTHGFAGIADYPRGSTFGPRLLSDHELVWVLTGAATWRLATPDGSLHHQQQLLPGTLALAPAGLVDSYTWERESRHAYLHLQVDAGAAGSHGWPLTRDITTHRVLAGMCGYLLDLARIGDAAARARSDQLAALLLEVFLTGPFPSPTTRPLPPVVREGLAHARATWERDGVRLLGVGELAGAAGVSTAHFSRAFAAATGSPPARVLELVRLARAAVALQRSNLSLAEVATLAGFADSYHLSRRFSAAYGRPPGRFRAAGEATDPLAPLAEAGLLGVWHHMARTE